MLVPFSNYPVNETFERLIAEELAALAKQAHQTSPLARFFKALFGRRDTACAQAASA